MTINKFQGKTKEEAIEKAKKALGDNAVIMNVKEIKPKGLFRAFSSSTYEVTAAMEEKEPYINPRSVLQNPKGIHDNINLAADEKIELSKLVKSDKEAVKPAVPVRPVIKSEQVKETEDNNDEKNLEKRLDDLSTMLEEKLGQTKEADAAIPAKSSSVEELDFVRILYSTLINNEVHENYANQIIGEIEQFIRPGNSVDVILANVYQKLILQFGRPHTIDLSGKKPKVVFFIGPTGVGKTTTIAKIASKYKVEYNRKVAFITADTYRIAATEQLQVYANILDAPMKIVYSAEELNDAVMKMSDQDLIFVDTAGFSHKNATQREDTKHLLDSLQPDFHKEVYLVLSATTKYKDLQDIVDIYKEISDYNLIFTKLDETSAYGNILNIKLYSEAGLSYVTMGQNVPDDIEVFNTQKIVKQLLGGK